MALPFRQFYKTELCKAKSYNEKQLEKESKNVMIDNLFIKRNRIFVEKIEEVLDNKSSTIKFFAMGVGHLIGEQNVVEMLQARGFKIERMELKNIEQRTLRKPKTKLKF